MTIDPEKCIHYFRLPRSDFGGLFAICIERSYNDALKQGKGPPTTLRLRFNAGLFAPGFKPDIERLTDGAVGVGLDDGGSCATLFIDCNFLKTHLAKEA